MLLLIGFKTGILCSLKMVHLCRDMSEIRLYYVCIINIVCLVGAINWVHGPTKCAEWTALKFIMSVWSVRPHGTTWLSLDGFSWNFIFEYFSKMCGENSRITGNLHLDACTFMRMSRWIQPRMWHVSDKSCRENENTRFMFNNFFPRKSCPLWDDAVRATHDDVIRLVCFACWITECTDKHSEYVILLLFHGKNSYANALQF